MGKIGDETKTERTFRHYCCSLDGIKETMAVEIRGTGSYIPEKIVENRELEQMVETTDVWIRERTGICRRHIAEKETVVDMGTQAAMQALQHSGISAQEIDLLIV